MRALIEDLQSALQSALVLGLDTPDAMERLSALIEPLRSVGLKVLAQAVERIVQANPTDDAMYATCLNEMARLWELAEQVMLRTHPIVSLPAVLPQRGWLLLDTPPEDPLLALLEGSVPVSALLPLLKAQIDRWTPDDSKQWMRLVLGHGATTRQAGERLCALGKDIVPILRDLHAHTTPLQRIRLAEVVLELYAANCISAPSSYLKRVPESLPLVRRAREMGLEIGDPQAYNPEALIHSDWVQSLQKSGLTRQSFNELVRRYAPQIMRLPDESPLLEWLFGSLASLAGSSRDLLELIARVPHPRATAHLLESPHCTPRAWELHIEATRDYRLVPQLMAIGDLDRVPIWGVVNSLADAILFPIVLERHQRLWQRYAEYALYVAQRWRTSSDPKKQERARQIQQQLQRGDSHGIH